ncbi:hypothetical protein H8356DRAFT_1428382 [Neocallimastix lanati (nom. inval.)]|nr:hypothetical protein H8356DRAFT_1428382 [Neocallimastix sp. JGI-2020a]
MLVLYAFLLDDIVSNHTFCHSCFHAGSFWIYPGLPPEFIWRDFYPPGVFFTLNKVNYKEHLTDDGSRDQEIIEKKLKKEPFGKKSNESLIILREKLEAQLSFSHTNFITGVSGWPHKVLPCHTISASVFLVTIIEPQDLQDHSVDDDLYDLGLGYQLVIIGWVYALETREC